MRIKNRPKQSAVSVQCMEMLGPATRTSTKTPKLAQHLGFLLRYNNILIIWTVSKILLTAFTRKLVLIFDIATFLVCRLTEIQKQNCIALSNLICRFFFSEISLYFTIGSFQPQRFFQARERQGKPACQTIFQLKNSLKTHRCSRHLQKNVELSRKAAE